MSEEERGSVSKRMIPNMATNAVFLILNAVIGLMLVPYFETTLGIAAYGIIPLATSVTSYMILISNSFSASIARFMAMSVEKKDMDGFSRTYYTAARGVAGIILMILPIGMLVALLSPYLFNTGGINGIEVQVLFAGVIISALVTSWGFRYQNALYSLNRIDRTNIMKVTQLLVQTAFIFLFFTLDGPSLWSVGVAYLIGAVFYVLSGHILLKKACPKLRPSGNRYDKAHFKEMSKISGWSLVESIGSLLMLQTAMVLTNLFLGPESNGQLGFIASIVYTMASVAGIMNTTFMPLIHYDYSRGKMDEMRSNIRSAINAIGIFTALPMAFICVFSTQILTVWVGGEYSHLSELLWIMLFLYPAFSAVGPLSTAGIAHMRVRALGLSTLISGALNVFLVMFFIQVLDMGLVGVAVAWTISMFVQKCVFMPLYYGKITGVGSFGYVIPVFRSVIYFIAAAAMCFAIDWIFQIPASLLWLLVAAAVIALAYMFIVPNLALSRHEKDLVRSCLPGFLRSRLPRWFL